MHQGHQVDLGGASPDIERLLAGLSAERIAALGQARADLFEVIAACNARGVHPVREVMASGAQPFTRYEHYPPDDVDDAPAGYAWYYHAHEPGDSRPWEEHGHFHCYAYPKLLAHAEPLASPPNGTPARDAAVSHLLGLCCSDRGVPNRIFTINRWASNEWLYPASDLLPLVERFALSDQLPHPRVSRWLSALVRLLSPQIGVLLRERDRVLGEARARDPAGYAEDRALDIVSTFTFDLDTHLEAVGELIA